MEGLPDGDYPFGAEIYPLARMAMSEAPLALQELLQAQATTNGVRIVRDQPVELVCQMPDMEAHRFLVYWPTGDRMHLLVPKELVIGQA